MERNLQKLRRLREVPQCSRSVLDCGGPPPLSHARHANERTRTCIRAKAVLKPPHSPNAGVTEIRLRTSRSVWNAARSPPLLRARHTHEPTKTFARSKAPESWRADKWPPCARSVQRSVQLPPGSRNTSSCSAFARPAIIRAWIFLISFDPAKRTWRRLLASIQNEEPGAEMIHSEE